MIDSRVFDKIIRNNLTSYEDFQLILPESMFYKFTNCWGHIMILYTVRVQSMFITTDQTIYAKPEMLFQLEGGVDITKYMGKQ